MIPCDCTDAAEVAAMVRAVTEELGGIDVLVNSIGAAKGGHFLELFLASARASFVTGTVVSVDGGATRCL